MATKSWSPAFDSDTLAWCDKDAGLAVDGLHTAGKVTADSFDECVAIVKEEVYVRLCLHDYPPIPDSGSTENGAGE